MHLIAIVQLQLKRVRLDEDDEGGKFCRDVSLSFSNRNYF